jgi:hypothetical protein
MIDTKIAIIKQLVIHTKNNNIQTKCSDAQQYLVTNVQYCLCEANDLLNMNHIINYLIFTPDEFELFEIDCVIDEVKLLLNGYLEIKFDNITKFSILGRMYYGVSLCPELSDKKGLKKFLKGKSTIKKSGLNFSRLDRVQIIIKSNVKKFSIYGIGFNILGTCDGRGFYRFSS